MEPVKWTPARSGWVSATRETAWPDAGDQVDHAGRQAGRLQQPHQVVRGELLGRRRLPDHHVAHQRGRGGQVARDRGEVERGDGQHEAFQRPVLQLVPAAGRRGGLLGQQAPGVVHVVAPEVDQLAGGVDLGLVGRLGLAEHGRGVDGLPPRAGQQVGRLEEDGRPVVEGQLPPAGGGQPGRLDGRRDVLVGGVGQLAEHMPVVVRLDHVHPAAAAHALLAADGHGQLGPVAGQLLDLLLERRPLLAPRRVPLDRLIGRHGDISHGIHCGIAPCLTRHRWRYVSSSHVGGRRRRRRPGASGRDAGVGRGLIPRCGAAPGWRTRAARDPRRCPRRTGRRHRPRRPRAARRPRR